MKTYKGRLVGGPEDGNSVEVTSPVIKVQNFSELWLDGENKTSTVKVESGTYYWNEKESHFVWWADSIDRQLQVA